MIRIMSGMCSIIAQDCLMITKPQTLRPCMSTLTSFSTIAEGDFWVCRTGLPGPLADGYPASESEEEDEADEDSNGASHAL
jgi:hypothetical protein